MYDNDDGGSTTVAQLLGNRAAMLKLWTLYYRAFNGLWEWPKTHYIRFFFQKFLKHSLTKFRENFTLLQLNANNLIHF